MTRFVAALLLVLGPLAAQAQARDPLHSAECGVARERLELALEEASAKREGARERLEARRREAIEACLGHFGGKAARSGAPEPSIGVAPVTVPPRTQPLLVPAPGPVSPPAVIPRPAAITTCDSAGCWDSEGRRLNNHGPVLMGPRGACVVQGGVVQCP